MNPSISIIITSYNYEKYIKDAIESVTNQKYENWELIIIDDGSKDNSVEIIKEFCNKNEKIKLYTHKNNENRGLKESLLLGIEKSQGEWISFLESDDLYKPETLFERINIINLKPEVNFIFNDVELFGNKKIIDEFENSYAKSRLYLNNIKFPTNVLNILEKRNIVPTFSSVMVRKKELIKCDFNCPVKALLDHYLWIQLARENKFYYINEQLTYWRMHESSYLNNYEKNKIEKIEMKNKISNLLAKHYKNNILKQLLYKTTILKNNIKKEYLKSKEMKLGVSYNLFDGEELLEASIKSIRKEAHYISVIYQKKSFRGERASENIEKFLYKLKLKNLIDEFYLYDKDFTKKEIKLEFEQEKRTIGLNLSKKNGCTHHLSMDVDEFYDVKQLKKVKEYITRKDIENTAVPIIEYLKTAEYKFVNSYLYSEDFDEYTFYCPFIMKINKILPQKYNKKWYPCKADPSRHLNNKKKFYLFSIQDIVMHHMSTVRKDLDRKYKNSNLMDGSSELILKINDLKNKVLNWKFEDNQIGNSKYALFENKLVEKTEDKFEIGVLNN